MKLRHLFIMMIALTAASLSSVAQEQYNSKQVFNLLAKYREDIPKEVIKRVKKEFKVGDSWPKIHDSWIENPNGKSIDLQGNTLFPNVDYNQCRQASATLFELNNFGYRNKKGVVRIDGTVIVPLENHKITFCPEINVIIAQVDWDEIEYSAPNKTGTTKIYDWSGNILYTLSDCTQILPMTDYPDKGKVNIVYKDSNGRHELPFMSRSAYSLDAHTSYFFEGPQAATYNLIRYFCASDEPVRGGLTTAMTGKLASKAAVLLDYYVNEIIPYDSYSRKQSRAIWDASLKYLATMIYHNNFSAFTEGHLVYKFSYMPLHGVNEPFVHSLTGLWKIPETEALRRQTEQQLFAAVNAYQRKQMRQAEQEQIWQAVLGVLCGVVSPQGGYGMAQGATAKTQLSDIKPGNTNFIMPDNLKEELVKAEYWVGTYDNASGSVSSSSATNTSSSHSSSSNLCRACYGSGKCPHCNGAGRYMPNTNGHYIDCTSCRKSGVCHQCNGQGHH